MGPSEMYCPPSPVITRTEIAAESFRLLVDSVQDYGIFMLDREGRVVTWNRGAERLEGYSSSEIIGRHFSIFHTEADQEILHPEHELALAAREGRYEEEGWRLRKDGTRFWASVVITRLQNPSGDTIGFVKIMRDLSERRKAEEALRRSHEDLETRVRERTEELLRANLKLKDAIRSRDDFLSIASHELRTPLTPLKLQVQSFQRYLLPESLDKLSPERLKRMASSIDRSMSRLEKLIENLLDVARINSGRMELNPEDCDVAEVVREVAARFRIEARLAGSELELELPNALPASLDRLRFEQILGNLLSNAIKYGLGKRVRVALGLSGAQLRLAVCDQGVGIAPDDINKLFHRFERLSQGLGTGGLGLGLFITKQIVEAHGGTIVVEGEPGKGTKFTVSLPYEPPLGEKQNPA